MQIFDKSINEIVPYPFNPRKNDNAVGAVAESIKEFGFKVPIVIDKEGTIVAGHTRYKAAKKLKLKTVPCIIADDLTDEQIKAFRLADNKVGELAEWDFDVLADELSDIVSIDMTDLGFDIDMKIPEKGEEEETQDERDPSFQHNVFENQERMQFEADGWYGMPEITATQTVGTKFLRFADWKEVDDLGEYIAHFYYDDYKFISAWREPEKYLERLKQFKAVISPDFSVYTDFPRALQITSCYRRQWCGAYWQYHGIDVNPDVVWGDEQSYDYCFEGIPIGSVVAVSSVGVKRDKEWNNTEGNLFKQGYEEMMRRLNPTKVLYYGDMIDGLKGDIIQIPSFYAERRGYLNERKEQRNGKRQK